MSQRYQQIAVTLQTFWQKGVTMGTGSKGNIKLGRDVATAELGILSNHIEPNGDGMTRKQRKARHAAETKNGRPQEPAGTTTDFRL